MHLQYLRVIYQGRSQDFTWEGLQPGDLGGLPPSKTEGPEKVSRF